eukprot:jgi/Psemu1/22589/gm1.22589_g
MVRSYTQPSTGPPTAIQAHQTLPLPPDNNPQEVRMDSANNHGEAEAEDEEKHERMRTPTTTTTTKSEEFAAGNTRTHTNNTHMLTRTQWPTRWESTTTGWRGTRNGHGPLLFLLLLELGRRGHSTTTATAHHRGLAFASEASKEEEDDNNDVDDENGLGSSPRPLKPTRPRSSENDSSTTNNIDLSQQVAFRLQTFDTFIHYLSEWGMSKRLRGCFKSEENLPSINGQKKDGMSGMAFHNFSSLTGGVLLSSSDDGDTSLNTNSMQIRFFETLEFSEEDDGG